MGKKILVIDDSPTVRSLHTYILKSKGYETETASNGVEGIEKLYSNADIALCVVDINMPKMDGLSLIREARKLLRFTPILALTTESQQTKRDEAKKSGATGWLVKPVGGADLVKVIKQVLPGA